MSKYPHVSSATRSNQWFWIFATLRFPGSHGATVDRWLNSAIRSIEVERALLASWAADEIRGSA